ncbi:hypothetical protein BC828DRAFT_394621 [Blastocladiella britannica]|nr:hypothetical protein BC828DRAFT_394621 [Blastocladiella britannica]
MPGFLTRLLLSAPGAPSAMGAAAAAGPPVPARLVSPVADGLDSAAFAQWIAKYHEHLFSDTVALFESEYGSSDEKYTFAAHLLFDVLLLIIDLEPIFGRPHGDESATAGTAGINSRVDSVTRYRDDGSVAPPIPRTLRRRALALVKQMHKQKHARSALFCSPPVLAAALESYLLPRYTALHRVVAAAAAASSALMVTDNRGDDIAPQAMSPLETLVHRVYTLAVLVEGGGLSFAFPSTWNSAQCDSVATETAARMTPVGLAKGDSSASDPAAAAARVRVVAPGICKAASTSGSGGGGDRRPKLDPRTVVARAKVVTLRD